MLRISYSRAARKAMEAWPAKHGRQIARRIEDLRTDPTPQDSQALKGKVKPFLRADAGEYRIIYRVEGEELMIAAIGRRNDDAIYKEFERGKKR